MVRFPALLVSSQYLHRTNKKCVVCRHAAYVVYNTSEEANAAELSIRNHPLHGKRMFARIYAPIKAPPIKPRLDLNSTINFEEDADLYVSSLVRRVVDFFNATELLPSPKPKHEYIDYDAFN